MTLVNHRGDCQSRELNDHRGLMAGVQPPASPRRSETNDLEKASPPCNGKDGSVGKRIRGSKIIKLLITTSRGGDGRCVAIVAWYWIPFVPSACICDFLRATC